LAKQAKTFVKGQFVFQEGMPSDHVAIIVDGNFEVFKKMPRFIEEKLNKGSGDGIKK
jgi:CRP-like cAMP-binding protein